MSFRPLQYRGSKTKLISSILSATALACIPYSCLINQTLAASDFDQLQKRQEEIFLQRQIEQKPTQPNVRLAPDQSIADDEIPTSESPCFVVNDIQLKPIDDNPENIKVTQSFQWALNKLQYPKQLVLIRKNTDLLGQCYGVKGINTIMKRLQNIIIQKGYITTRIVAGQQALNNETLELTLIPGRIRHIQFDRSQHILPFKEGDLLNLREIEQALENLKSLASVQADIQIVPATGDNTLPGESDLVILWQQSRPWQMGLSYDDSGVESTGELQGTLFFSYEDLANINDTLNLNIGRALGAASPIDGNTESYGLTYRVPFKNSAMALSINKNDFFQIIEGIGINSRYSGVSNTGGIEYSHTLFRSSSRRLIGGIEPWYRESKNFIEEIELNSQRKKTTALRAKLKYREFLGQSIVNASLVYHHVFNMDDESLTLLTNQENPKPKWLTTDLRYNRPLTFMGAPIRYSNQLRYQQNFDPLSSLDYFVIGNRYNVRTGNNSSNLSAERGWMIRNDFETARPTPWAIFYFGLDYGQVSGNAFIEEWNDLSAFVIGLKGQIQGFSYELSRMSALSSPAGFQENDDLLQFAFTYTL